MLQTVKTMKELPFGQLMEVYQQGNLEKAAQFWPELSEGEGLLQAEQEFYQYLREVFFRTPRAVYYLWSVSGRCVSALRLEPYRDGLLLEALETAPEARRKGYAKDLVQAVLAACSTRPVYSHVEKRNVASLQTHIACGFQRVSEQAMYLDGSVNAHCCTFKIM